MVVADLKNMDVDALLTLARMSKERSASGLVNWKGSLHVLVGLQARSVAGPLGELCAQARSKARRFH